MACRLIAHRGEPRHWPDNSLAGFRAVLEAGACYVEADVQISADHVAVLCHDDSLYRMTGRDLVVSATLLADIQALPAGEPARFGAHFDDSRIATLATFGALLANWPAARAFVEIKPAGIRAFGAGAAVDMVLGALGNARHQCIPISFDYRALQYLRAHTDLPVGWVLPEWSEAVHRRADALSPQYLFARRERVPRAPLPLWDGPWRWVAYTADRVSEIERLFAQGFELVETNDIRRMMRELGRRA